MKELADMLAEARRLRDAGQPFALATVVKINGSSYRRPGARMLITPEGTTHGTISGGCLEGEVAQHALNLMDAGAPPEVHAFDLSDDDLILGFGIGCDGTVHVLIEPIETGTMGPLAWVEHSLDRRTRGVIATVSDAPEGSGLLGQRMWMRPDGPTEGALGDDALTAAVRDAASAVLDTDRAQIQSFDTADGPADVLFEVVRPPVHLLIFGGGHDVRPVARIGKELGWQVTIVGSKPADELAPKFPEADEHVFLMNAAELRDYVSVDARTPAVVMNHQYERDKTLIHQLLMTPAPYVGALGPRDRTERITSELQAEDPSLTDAPFRRLHGPVGLDIGTETPQEIALAIVAEIQAVLHDRSAQKLREREGPIHERVPTT
jgi:xanthine/CO dehydrogenase XdhC/CoxF family maturation factor